MTDQNVPAPSSEALRAFEQALLDHGKARVTRADLWLLWKTADLALPASWAARPRLAHALTHLADEGVIELPSRSGSLWDHGLFPLPERITVPANRRTAARLLDPAHEPWAPALSWIPAWMRENRPPQQLRLDAVAVNRWILATTGLTPARVAREERSLHIFNDEKRLAHLAQGPLFSGGRLTLDLLACEAPLGGLRIAKLRDAGPVLIVENKSTFDSCWRSLRASPDPGYAAVIFGGGDSVASLIDDLVHLAELHQIVVTELHYAGDVDIAGIEAAALFADAANTAGLSSRMSIPLWNAVARAEPTGDDLTASPARKTPAISTARELDLPDTVITHLLAGRRVPQERVDRTQLADVQWWHPDAAW
ncbi:Wadjet anti-phage system protein JetD domain-containing protein [Sphaerisporangium sp. NPDC005289]|uniref:Wadjet anti-phage system protein JetD domain-containing protein n=1 Tax=Sphaerisporangium sp. NPDC005289 TaxID=3155247 RepID=UPI0033ACA3F5